MAVTANMHSSIVQIIIPSQLPMVDSDQAPPGRLMNPHFPSTKQEPYIILRFLEVELTYALNASLDDIFYGSSSVQEFASEAERTAFRERWLGSYLTIDPKEAFLAFSPSGQLAGYVVGALQDPALSARYAEQRYFRDFAPHTRSFPAHLHINVAAQYRSRGLGAMLIETFATHAKAQGLSGVHVVTDKSMRNVGFYIRNGFVPIAEAPHNGRTVVMLGRSL